jgi:hypothetical protein
MALSTLDRAGFFNPPISGDWYEGAFLVRASPAEPALAREIMGRFTRDPHPAAAVVTVQAVQRLGPDSAGYLEQSLERQEFGNSWAVSHALEDLLESWSEQGHTQSFPRFADLALEPIASSGTLRPVRAKFAEFHFKSLVDSFVERCDCANIFELAKVLGYKVRRLVAISPSGGLIVSLSRELIEANERDERDVGDALISGLRDALRKMRECGEPLDRRRETLGALDSEIFIRIWAGHLADEGGEVP